VYGCSGIAEHSRVDPKLITVSIGFYLILIGCNAGLFLNGVFSWGARLVLFHCVLRPYNVCQLGGKTLSAMERDVYIDALADRVVYYAPADADTPEAQRPRGFAALYLSRSLV